ncbi:hypothetical protein KA001_03190 [Patescibacteria group bacterium]|nr:hypothetical protein [Patescibacteria group bacterium]
MKKFLKNIQFKKSFVILHLTLSAITFALWKLLPNFCMGSGILGCFPIGYIAFLIVNLPGQYISQAIREFFDFYNEVTWYESTMVFLASSITYFVFGIFLDFIKQRMFNSKPKSPK